MTLIFVFFIHFYHRSRKNNTRAQEEENYSNDAHKDRYLRTTLKNNNNTKMMSGKNE